MPVVYPIPIDKASPFLGEACALCKQPFGPGEDIVVCPDDASRHHVHCWESNDGHCTAYGCSGAGEVYRGSGRPVRLRDPDAPVVVTPAPTSKVRTLPTSSIQFAQSCLMISIAVAILLFAFSCFGLWAIVDFFVQQILGWEYREPLIGIVLLFF